MSDNSDGVPFEYEPMDSKGLILLTLKMPDGTSFTEKFDVTSSRNRERVAAAVHERFAAIGEAEARAQLECIAAQVVKVNRSKTADSSDGADSSSPILSQADLLVALVTENKDIELFHAGGEHDSEAYATIRTGPKRMTLPVASRAFRNWIVGAYRKVHSKVPGTQAMTDALNAVSGIAIHDGEEHPVAVRLAEHAGAIWLDLGDPEWRAVCISAQGWIVVKSEFVPVRFIHKRGMLALPVPEAGGSIDALWQFVNVPDRQAQVLLAAFLIGCLRARGPYAILVISGEQGSAKSTTCRIIKLLVDPCRAPLRRPPRDDRDIMIAAANGWLMAFDNISGVHPNLSDTLCSLATGAGFATRELYSDGDEKLFDAARPILLNGIDAIATRSDLLDRSVVLDLPAIPKEQRRDEDELWAAFEIERPKILGALLDGVVAALRNLPTMEFPPFPRMADFAKWAIAAESGLGWEPGTFLAAYEANIAESNSIAIESSAIGEVLLEFMRDRSEFDDTATVLFKALSAIRNEDEPKATGDWPKNAASLSKALKRLAPNLRRIGIEVLIGRGEDRKRTRGVRLWKVGNVPSDPSEPSASGPDDLAEGDGCVQRADSTSSSSGSSCPTETDARVAHEPTADSTDTSDSSLPINHEGSVLGTESASGPSIDACTTCADPERWRASPTDWWRCWSCDPPEQDGAIERWSPERGIFQDGLGGDLGGAQ